MNPIVIEELLSSLGLMGESATAAATGARATAAEFSQLENTTGKLTKTSEEFNKRLKDGVGKLEKLYDEIVELKEGARKYNEVVDELTGTVATVKFGLTGLSKLLEGDLSGAAKNFLGTITAAGSKVFNDFAKRSLIQQDLLTKSYQSLSQFGAIDPTGLRGLLNNLEDIGTTPDNAEFFIRAIGKASEQMVMFGGTVAEGAYGITQIVKKQLDAGEQYEGQLNQLGYTTEDITKFTTSFIADYSRNSKINAGDTEKLRKQSFEYMTVLQELSELTGVSRDRQEENIRELQADIQFRSYLRQLAKTEGGAEKVTRAKLLMESFAGNKELQTALKEDLATGGAIISQTGAMQQNVLSQIRKSSRDVINGTVDTTIGIADAHKKAGVEVEKTLDRAAGTIAVAGKEGAQAFGVAVDQFDFSQKAATMDPEKVKAMTAAALTQQDERIKVETERRKLERQVANYYQELTYAVGDLAVPATKYLAEAALFAAKALDKIYGNVPILEKARQRAPLSSEIEKAAANKAIDESSKREPPISDVEGHASWQEAHDRLLEQYSETSKITVDRDKLLKEERQNALERARLEAARLEVEKGRQRAEARKSSSTINNEKNLSQVVDERINKIVEDFKKLHPDTRLTSTTGGDHVAGSKHYEGRAGDIAFNKKISDLEFETYKKQLQDLGATNIRNEMERPKGPAGEKWTGPHIHFEVPEKPVGPNGNKTSLSIPTLNQSDTTLASNLNPAINPGKTQDNQDNKLIISKLDDLNTLFNRSLRVQEDILAHTKTLA